MTARTLTAHERWDRDTETFVADTAYALRRDPGGVGQGHNTNFIADTLTSGSHPASNMPGRHREDDTNIVAETIRSHPRPGSNNNGSLHPSGVRRLTPRECERLQGFPDDWTLIPGASDSKRYAALGDAVTVPVAEWIGRRLIEVAA